MHSHRVFVKTVVSQMSLEGLYLTACLEIPLFFLTSLLYFTHPHHAQHNSPVGSVIVPPVHTQLFFSNLVDFFNDLSGVFFSICYILLFEYGGFLEHGL